MKKRAYLHRALFLVLLATPLLAQSGSPAWGEAAWVWDQADANQAVQSNDPRYLRLPFELTAKATHAELWITADNHYVAYVNGHKIGEDGEWSTVEKYDVAKHLVPGKNVLAILARNQGGPAGVLARLHVRNVDKKDLFVVTDSKTRITQNTGKDWLERDHDDSKWATAAVLGDVSIGPWSVAAAPSVAQAGKGSPKNYGSSAVDPKIKNRLSAEEERKHFIVPEGFEVELVAAEPVVINPITMTMDERGRLYVSESHTYRYGPQGSPVKPFANPVVRLEPDGKGLKRTLIADGFDDPVMGIAVKADKLWLTANNYLYTYDLPETGAATNKKVLLTDKNKAWNPFGMFVLEWGPDGKLYMSVGNHGIDIRGPDGTLTSRGGSGMILRMNPDGTKMERLVHGLRVPYSFEFDPFGQLWLLSNGEGNPDRFVRVLEGVDYHCYSRGVDNNWLAGNHPLAPPCEEVHGGAHTQLLRYYSAAYPQEFQGNLFACNWGRHGFGGANRGIFRFVLDDRNNVVKKETLLTSTDPHFRPAHIVLDSDGNLLIADWYGRDDESDMTGRIWRLKYVGKDRPVVKHRLDADEWKNDDYALEALGSPHHLIRAKAVSELMARGQKDEKLMVRIGLHARDAKEPLAAANALWALMRMKDFRGTLTIATCMGNPDWRVRRLVLDLMRHYNFVENTRPLAHERLAGPRRDADPAVRSQAAITLSANEIVDVLRTGAAADAHLRYEAASHLAKHADEQSIAKVLASDDADVRLAGLIAIDVACYENFPTKKFALAALAKAIENPGKLDHQLLLTVAHLDGDASIVPALEKLLARDDLPAATVAKAVLVLRAKAANPSLALRANEKAGKRLIEAVEKGSLKIVTPADQLFLFEFLEADGSTPFALKQIGGQLRSSQPAVRQAAHGLARRFGPKSADLADPLWSAVFAPKAKFDESIDFLSTIARIEASPSKERWERLLAQDDVSIRAEAVRWWRKFKGNDSMVDVLVRRAPELIKQDEGVKDDLAAVFRHLETDNAAVKALKLPAAMTDKESLTKDALKEIAALSAADRQKRAAMGLQVFERNACTKCHTTATQTTLLAPSLKGSAGQKLDYLIESVLYPSKIIKTGWETETIETKNGRVLNGLVKDDGVFLRVLNMGWGLQESRVAKTDVANRELTRRSIMPEGQETQLSRREFVDLIVYLATLK